MNVIPGGARPALEALEQRDDFVRRHIGPGEAEIRAMLCALGESALEKLVAHAMPKAIYDPAPLDLPPAMAENESRRLLHGMALKNRDLVSMIGLGYSGTITPAVIRRYVLENPGWYTAFTPYQPLIWQGRLELILAYQTMIGVLSGL
jgi:glycine dehydrogenase